MSSGESDDELDELLSPASHAARFTRRFSDDEDDSSEDDFSDDAVASASGGHRVERSSTVDDTPEGMRSEWGAAVSDGGESMSDDSDSDASASADDDEVADQMRKEYEAYQREREERARVAAEAAARTAATQEAAAASRDARSTVDSDSPSSQNLKIVAAALRANRQLQDCIREQLEKLEGARLINSTALAEWQQDQRRVRQADRAMRGLLKRQYVTAQGSGRPATTRYRRGGYSYFGRDAPAPGDAATQQARRTVVDLVPLTYPSAHWSAAETEKLREAVRQSCQHRAMVLLDQQTAKEDVAEAHFGPSDHADEGDDYTRQVNELRNLTLLQLLRRLEEDGALAPGGAVCGGDDGKDILNWNDVARRARLRRTADDCRVHWSAVADPRIDVSEWTSADTNTLKMLAEQHEGHSWERIASQVGSGRRTAFACFQKYQLTKNSSQLGRRAWDDPAENVRLVELVQELGTKWKEVARRLGTGRKAEACMQRYRFAVGINDEAIADRPGNPPATEAMVIREGATKRGRGKWTPEEDVRLEEAVKFYTEEAKHDLARGIKRKRTGRLPAGARGDRAADGQEIQIPWSKVARHVPRRNGPQCRDHWTSSLDPSLNFLPWGQKENRDLTTLVMSMGVDVAPAGSRKWSEVANALGTGRTDAQVRKQWKTLQNQRQRASAAVTGRAIVPARVSQANAGARGERTGPRGRVGDSAESVGPQRHTEVATSFGDEAGP